MNSITRRIATAATLAGAAALLLTACTAGSTPDAKDSTKPTASATTGTASLEKVTAKCENGAAVLKTDDANKQITLGDCKTVTVEASNAVVKLGNVDKLVVKGAISGVTAGEVKTLEVTGNGNIVTTKNADVKVTDSGDQNDINKK